MSVERDACCRVNAISSAVAASSRLGFPTGWEPNDLEFGGRKGVAAGRMDARNAVGRKKLGAVMSSFWVVGRDAPDRFARARAFYVEGNFAEKVDSGPLISRGGDSDVTVCHVKSRLASLSSFDVCNGSKADLKPGCSLRRLRDRKRTSKARPSARCYIWPYAEFVIAKRYSPASENATVKAR